jgi:hypothetical protein
MQGTAKGILRGPSLRGDLQDLLEEPYGPIRVRGAEILGRDGQERLQQMLLVFVKQRPTSPAYLVL